MPYLALSMAAFFWGGNYVVGKVLSESVNAIDITVFRWLGASILIFALYLEQHGSFAGDLSPALFSSFSYS